MHAGPASLTLELPECPSLNKMIDLAKERTRRTASGAWLKRPVPIVYDNAKKAYELECLVMLNRAGFRVPSTPWQRWAITDVEFRLHNLRDPLELVAGLKWVADFLVTYDVLANDSARELVSICVPRQRIDRKNRGVTITIQEIAA